MRRTFYAFEWLKFKRELRKSEIQATATEAINCLQWADKRRTTAPNQMQSDKLLRWRLQFLVDAKRYAEIPFIRKFTLAFNSSILKLNDIVI